MTRSKIKRALIYAAGGGLLGFSATYAYIQFGST
jgi:hypothetical protein